MNRLENIVERCWLSVCRTHAKYLSRLYARYKRKSIPVQMGEYTVIFETYCTSIQKECNALGLPIPEHQPRVPKKVVKRYLSWRWGWPWPVRIVLRKGKAIIVTATTPDEMARAVQQIWNTSRVPHNKPMEAVRTTSIRSNSVKTTKESGIDIPPHKTRIVDSPQLPGIVLKPSNANSSTKTAEEPLKVSLTEVAGAIIDNSF